MKIRLVGMAMVPILAILLAGCVTMNVQMTVNPNDQVTAHVTIGVAKQLDVPGLDLPSIGLINSSQELCDLAQQAVGNQSFGSGTFSPDDSDPNSYACRITTPTAPVSQVQYFSQTKGRIVFAFDPNATALSGVPADELNQLIAVGFTFQWSVTFPGKILSTDAQRTGGTTAIWDDPTSALVTTGMHAEAEDAGRAHSWITYVLIGVAVAVTGLIVLVVVLSARRRQRAARAAAAAQAYAPPDQPGPYPAP